MFQRLAHAGALRDRLRPFTRSIARNRCVPHGAAFSHRSRFHYAICGPPRDSFTIVTVAGGFASLPRTIGREHSDSQHATRRAPRWYFDDVGTSLHHGGRHAPLENLCSAVSGITASCFVRVRQARLAGVIRWNNWYLPHRITPFHRRLTAWRAPDALR